MENMNNNILLIMLAGQFWLCYFLFGKHHG